MPFFFLFFFFIISSNLKHLFFFLLLNWLNYYNLVFSKRTPTSREIIRCTRGSPHHPFIVILMPSKWRQRWQSIKCPQVLYTLLFSKLCWCHIKWHNLCHNLLTWRVMSGNQMSISSLYFIIFWVMLVPHKVA